MSYIKFCRFVVPGRLVARGGAVLGLALIAGAVVAATKQPASLLRIGTSGSLAVADKDTKETTALGTLQNFIKKETGLDNEIVRQKDWQELAEKMASKHFQLGVFQGYELAWAQEKYPALKPLALAVNVYRYPTAYVVARKDNAAKDFSGLQGQSIAITGGDVGFLRLFVDRECEALQKNAKTFFSRVATPDSVEDTVDDLVDGSIQAVAELEAYKRRKPSRFAQLKAVAESKPFPPVVVAYYDGVVDPATLDRFRDGLLGASQKESGQTLLTLFRLTKFEAVPADFDSVLTRTRQTYPPPANNPQK
jgi:ABC-type phosphate/phosphonate transport system substrate-binding protein